MSRVLLAWEMGSNLGHLSRMFPLARRLKSRGHQVLAVVCDLRLASSILDPLGIEFVQAPILPMESAGARPLVSYADMLLVQGWDDPGKLQSLVAGWAALVRLFSPQVIIADHSPTAILTAHVTDTSCGLVGTGFECPPPTCPLPLFPRLAGAVTERAIEVETQALRNANAMLQRHGARPLDALRELFDVERIWLTTFPELDHYGARSETRYIGPIGAIQDGERIEWPIGFGERIFAYLRPGTPTFQPVLEALSAYNAAVVCCVPGLDPSLIEKLRRPGFIVTPRPVNLATLLPKASACVTYSPAGTVTAALLHGIPQLLAPAHVEAQLTAQRVEAMGAGLVLRGRQDKRTVGTTLSWLLQRPEFASRARLFAQRYRGFDPAAAADAVVSDIESIAAGAAARVCDLVRA